MTQRIIVEHRKRGGCLSAFAFVLVVAIAYRYWYVTVPIGVLLAGGFWYYRENYAARPCARCGTAVSHGARFCSTCGQQMP